jgi:hypothetical protein
MRTTIRLNEHLDSAAKERVEAASDSEVERRLLECRVRDVDEGEITLLDWEDVKVEVARVLNRR